MGFSVITGDPAGIVMRADNASFDGTYRGGVMNSNGQLWIGSAVAPHVRRGSLTSVDGSITISTGPGTIDLASSEGLGRFPITPFVVGPVGQAGYQTIQAALDAANTAGGGIVYVQPGTYTENLNLYSGTEIIGTPPSSDTTSAGNSVIISGVHTPPSTGLFSFSQVRLESATHVFNSNVAGDANIIVKNCGISLVNGYIFNLPNWIGTLFMLNLNDFSLNNGIVNNPTGTSGIIIQTCSLGGGSNVLTGAANDIVIRNSNIYSACTFDQSAIVGCYNSSFFAAISFTNSTVATIFACYFSTDAVAAINIDATSSCSISQGYINSSNNPAIDGNGTLNYTDIVFESNSSIAGTLTVASKAWKPYGTSGNTSTSIRGTAGFDSTQFSVSDGFVQLATGLGRFPITPYVVGSSTTAGYTTIQSALNAANAASGGIVYVQPGTYTENLTLYANTQVVGTPGNSNAATSQNTVIISGVHTPPTTGSFTFANVDLVSATHVFSSASAGSAPLTLSNCQVNLTNGYVFNVANWTGALAIYNCFDISTQNGVVTNTGGSAVTIRDSTIGAGGSNTMGTTGSLSIQNSIVNCLMSANTGTTITCDFVLFTKAFVAANNSTGKISNCRFETGSSPFFSMSSSANIYMSNCVANTSNSPCMLGGGAGVLYLGNVTFLDSYVIPSNVNVGTSPSYTSDPLYLDQGSSATVKTNSGSFSTTGITLTTPATTNLKDGDRLEFVATSGVLVVQLAATQIAHVGSVASSAAGTLTSTATGDALILRYQSSTNDWWATSVIGTWVLA